MYALLPEIQFVIPGCGLSFANVWDCPYDWWDIYVRRLDNYIAQKKKAKGTRRGH